MSYSLRFVKWPIQSGIDVSWFVLSQRLSKRSERRPESLLNKNPHAVHARASCDCKAVSRSFPYGFHSPALQSSFNMVSVRDLQKRRKEKPSVNHLKLKPSTYCPQPAARVSTHLYTLKLKTDTVEIRKKFYSPHPLQCSAEIPADLCR